MLLAFEEGEGVFSVFATGICFLLPVKAFKKLFLLSAVLEVPCCYLLSFRFPNLLIL